MSSRAEPPRRTEPSPVPVYDEQLRRLPTPASTSLPFAEPPRDEHDRDDVSLGLNGWNVTEAWHQANWVMLRDEITRRTGGELRPGVGIVLDRESVEAPAALTDVDDDAVAALGRLTMTERVPAVPRMRETAAALQALAKHIFTVSAPDSALFEWIESLLRLLDTALRTHPLRAAPPPVLDTATQTDVAAADVGTQTEPLPVPDAANQTRHRSRPRTLTA